MTFRKKRSSFTRTPKNKGNAKFTKTKSPSWVGGGAEKAAEKARR